MLNVIIFFTLLGLLAIPTYKEPEEWGTLRKIYFGFILLLFVLFFFKFFFIY